ncbi:MAG: hypothetical protein HZY76_00415 [Anaerolineae bacterium]|nr:MAG: hypothetical protein HZY76_00415 [Anaerolineae bacterium]
MLSADGQSLVFSTYLGGDNFGNLEGADDRGGIAVAVCRRDYLASRCGATCSGQQWSWRSMLGLRSREQALADKLPDAGGNIYLTGTTRAASPSPPHGKFLTFVNYPASARLPLAPAS